MTESDDRFGVSRKTIERLFHDQNWLLRDGTYVPTKEEVRTLPITQLSAIIISWMWESPSELIPNNSQIESVVQILQEREDADTTACTTLLKECKKYLGTEK
jgi:hypothetical protein